MSFEKQKRVFDAAIKFIQQFQEALEDVLTFMNFQVLVASKFHI